MLTADEEYLQDKEQACGLDKYDLLEMNNLPPKGLTNKLIEVEWLYEDELDEPEHRYSKIISSHTDNALGRAIAYCQDRDNMKALDAILADEFDEVDDNIVFYLTDINDEDDEVIKAELRESNNMVVFGLAVVDEVN